MPKLMHKLYDNLEEAKAFAISFTNFVYFYDDVSTWDFHTEICEKCGKTYQSADYLAPKANCKKPTGILHSLEPGVSPSLRDELIENFDVTEADFRPVRTKKDEIAYYQITPQHTLLPLHEVNMWPILSRCANCGNVRYNDIPKKNQKNESYHYITPEALTDMHDLNVTFERFHRDYPLFVISRRLYDFLIERYPRTHYFPFFLKEEV